ncbi:MAG: RNA polymerase factor sigma-54 [Planctomycetota bacterium]|nr:RNA polymerase factor sigma-54 [Planctomycetota bacterium]
MRFDTSQQMKLGQQMKLAPRMIQSMEILQLPLQALEERIEQELESNVTLEIAEPGADEQTLEAMREQQERDDTENERPLTVDESGSGADDFERLDSFQQNYAEAAENEFAEQPRPERFDEATGSFSRARMDGERDAKLDAMANTAARAQPLADQLLEQWSFADVDEELREPGRLLISYIDDDGYIRTGLETIRDHAPEPKPEPAVLARALLAVQLFLDPPGIGARDVRECLLLQVDHLIDDPGHEGQAPDELRRARDLIDKHLDDLIHNRIPRVAQKSGLTVEEIRGAVEQMRRLSLHPGRALVAEAPPSIVPDAIVEYDDDKDEYFAYLSDARLPNLRVSREYARMAADRSVPRGDRQFIKTNLSNAQWLIDAIRQRRQTLLRVINVVVAAQREFFDHGPSSLRPLPMTQVADQLGIHVATVSRAVAGKHIQTPRGVFALRKFFSGGTQTEGGEDVAWEAVRAALQEVVDGEDKARPLSDEAIVDELKKRGIEIARRTVAKYRGQLNIPPARMRRTF